MSGRYLKHVPTGQIFAYQSHFAAENDFVEVADVQGTALPEAIEGEFKRVDETVPEAPSSKKRKKAEEDALKLADELAAALASQEALNADASRGV